MAKFVFPQSHLTLVPAIERLARKDAANGGTELEDDADLVDYFGEWHMENLSEGSGQWSHEEELSCRSFTGKLRLNPAEVKRLHDAVGFDRGNSFREFGLSNMIVQALAGSPELAGVLARIKPRHDEPAKGPFYAREPRLSLQDQYQRLASEAAGSEVSARDAFSNYCAHVADVYRRELPAMIDPQLIPFAGCFKVEPREIDRLAKGLSKAGIQELMLATAVADVILNVVRVTPQFSTALRWAQFDADRI